MEKLKMDKAMEFYIYKEHKARKEHECEMCGQIIKVGEEYSEEIGKYEGEFFSRKLHIICYDTLCEILSEMSDM